MKKTFSIAALLVCAFVSVYAQSLDGEVVAESMQVSKEGQLLKVDLELNLSEIFVKSNRMIVITPRLVTEEDTLSLSSVGIYGRRRYYFNERNEKKLDDAFFEINYKEKELPSLVEFHEVVPFESWMNGAQIEVCKQMYGCCNDIIDEDTDLLGSFLQPVYVPLYAYLQPAPEARKTREIKGSAFVDFPVSQTVIYPDYRENRRELAKIIASIDSVKNDDAVIITAMSIKGHASPESPYDNNERLAKGRTQALKEYVTEMYNFEPGFIQTSYEPEDWENLRIYVENSNITHKQQILDIIDMDREPDPKEWILKSRYPQEYKFLLANCYPALRHSDYRIEYVVKGFQDIEEIKKVRQTRPGNLSLHELYLLSTAYEPGTDEFNDVFELAVILYPSDPVANLNAANAAISRGEFAKAEKYLAKAGWTPYTTYARGVLAAINKNFSKAEVLFEEAMAGGVPEAAQSLEDIKPFLDK